MIITATPNFRSLSKHLSRHFYKLLRVFPYTFLLLLFPVLLLSCHGSDKNNTVRITFIRETIQSLLECEKKTRGEMISISMIRAERMREEDKKIKETKV
jgi:hypothetical protein